MLRAKAAATTITVGVASFALYALRRRRNLYGLRSIAYQSEPPILTKKPHKVAFGNVEGEDRGSKPMETLIYRDDPYFWVRDDTRTNKEVIRHLEQENAYTNYMMKHVEGTVDELYQELLSHVQEDDASVPYKYGPYMYYTKTLKGSSYKIHCRKKDIDDDEHIILDENELAAGLKHCDVRSVEPSPDHSILAFAIDDTGDEIYSIRFKNLKTGEFLDESIEKTSGSIEWGADNTTVYYTTPDKAHRTDKVWKHVMGKDHSKAECLATEPDPLFRLGIYKSRSARCLFILSSSSETTEYQYIDLNKPEKGLQLIKERETGVIFYVDHHEDKFYIVTNKDGATNFKLVSCPMSSTSSDTWLDVFQYDPAIKIDEARCFKNFIVISGRQDGFSQLWIVDLQKGNTMKRLKFDDPVYAVHADRNYEYNTTKFRFRYSSPIAPTVTYDYDMISTEKTFLKETPCPHYDRNLYECKRLEATAEDGTLIPMSIVYRKDLRKEGVNPVHLYGYGSYEITVDPDFKMSILPLLDRGVIYAIAHIRGGGAMGRTWYEDAKYLNKIRTFTDFINCAEHLISSGMTNPSMLSIEGRSAGGLLMGAVLNMRPDLFKAAVAGVPFVDVLTTMCDPSIPLTTGEWEEWGNPNEKKYYDYMEKYSPVDNVKAQAYPSILITSGLHDPRVAYWEPTKWCAKLRELKTDNNPLLLKMDLSSGHFSASDRYHYLKEKAFDLAFILDQLGRVGPKQ